MHMALSILKVFGRQLTAGDELGSQRSIGALLQLALELGKAECQDGDEAQLTALACNETLTCVANAMLLDAGCKTHFAVGDGFAVVSEILSSTMEHPTTTFLCGRCLFLALTTSDSAKTCVEKLQVQEPLSDALETYLQKGQSPAGATGGFTPEQVMGELFKAAMSLTVFYQRSATRSSESSRADQSDVLTADAAVTLKPILSASLDALAQLPLADGRLSSPAKQAASIVLNFSTLGPAEIQSLWFPTTNRWQHISCLLSTMTQLIDQCIADLSSSPNRAVSEERQIEVAPIVLVLLRVITENPEARTRIFNDIYPQGADYTQLPEDRPGTSSKLVRIMKSPQGGVLPSAVGDLLYFLWQRDARQFVMAVGYGNAAGYMLARGIEIPTDLMNKGGSDAKDRVIDPVTGKYLGSDGIAKELAEMTDEEKEREAERLFVLFERLNKTGIIKVENPVRAAYESGQIQEMSDDDSSGS
ncbi:hypothetical protein EC988_001177 [Linderina pennispora]|nr:hypothetical protein EC988_001177 [Linderina pennispora]